MPARLRLAVLLSSISNALLVITARYRLSYDAYTHMFFADHYLHHWGSLWEPRWYAGFTVVSYPPLVHQVMALLARLVGVDAAFGILLWAVLAAMPLAVYAFARIFNGAVAAGYAALGAAFLPALYLSAYAFGQLPTLAATLFSLWGFAWLARFLRTGRRLDGALTVALLAVVMAAHHGTLLLLPCGAAAVSLHLYLNRQVPGRSLLYRLVLVGLPAILAVLFVAWPFWLWGLGQSMQTPIDHLSRHNFLTDGYATLIFFWPVYGPLVAVIPFALGKLFRRRTAALCGLFAILFILGLGGTTPLPRWLFGSGWAWLTYDRFALWAALVLLVFFGEAAVLARRRIAFRLLTPRLSAPAVTMGWASGLRRLWVAFRRRLVPKDRRAALTRGAFGLLGFTVLIVVLIPVLVPTQPPVLDMRPIVAFLNAGDHAQWRYLTFGFGDQFAYLSRLTEAGTIDGSYHTARSIPELRTSGIGQIDTVLWSDKPMQALDPILAKASQYGVRWGFVDRTEYDPVLRENGWSEIGSLSDGVEIWQNLLAVRPDRQSPPDDPLQAFSWSVLPLSALALAGILAAARLHPRAVQRRLLDLHALAASLVPLSLGFWYYRQLVAVDIPRVYFTYDNLLLFLSDALGLMALIAWGLARLVGPLPGALAEPNKLGRWLTRLLFAFCALASLSTLWSVDAQVSLFTALHLWLLFGLYCSLKDRPGVWRLSLWSASAGLLLQAGIGILQFMMQSTAFLSPLHMQWPGVLDPAMHGASVVQLADGARWLRVYGTLPHPNILAGLALLLLIGPVAWFLLDQRGRWLAASLVIAGTVLICLSFSRGAYLGCAAALGVLIYHYRSIQRRRFITLGLLTSAGLLAAFLPLNPLVLTRLGGEKSLPEQISIEDRTWLAEQSLAIIRTHPLLGVGIGTFPIQLARQAGGTFLAEPVHNLPLLSASELGLPGILLLTALGLVVAIGILKARQPSTIIASAVLAGLAITALFDHYLWTLAPGRMMLWWLLGLWAGRLALEGEPGGDACQPA